MQQTFAEASFEQYRKSTRRERFLDEMNRVVPWAELVAVIEPVYPKADGPGRPPVGIERMLRLLCLQQWFNLSDPAVEEALCDSRAMRQFGGIDLGREPVPDETTICKFRHLLEAHQLGAQLWGRISAYLAAHGMTLSRGTIVDATIIAAPVRQRIARRGGIRRCVRPREGEPVVLRYESPHRRGQPDHIDPFSGDYGRQCA